MHYSRLLIPANDPLERLPPTQTRGIPGCQGKTPVAQMHFASELPLSHSDSITNMDGQEKIIQANRGATGKEWGNFWKLFPLSDFLQFYSLK